MPYPFSAIIPRGTTKPPLGAAINKCHPMASHIKYAFLFNEGAGCPGDNIQQLLNYRATLKNPSGSGWISTPYGLGFQFGTTTYIELNTTGAYGNFYGNNWPPTKYSVFAIVSPNGTGTTRAILGAGNSLSPLEFRLSTANKLDLVKPGTADIIQSTSTLTQGNWYTCGVSYDTVAGTGAFYINGKQDSTFSGHVVSFTNEKPIPFAQDYFGLQDYWTGQAALLVAWERLLTPQDHLDMHFHPYDMWPFS